MLYCQVQKGVTYVNQPWDVADIPLAWKCIVKSYLQLTKKNSTSNTKKVLKKCKKNLKMHQGQQLAQSCHTINSTLA